MPIQPIHSLSQMQFEIQIDRPLIPANQTSERYLMVSLTAPAATVKKERMPLNLSLIIDRSGSMSGQKLEYVKEAAIHVLRTLSDRDRVSIIAYDDQVTQVAASQAVTAQVRESLINRVREIRTGGMTNLSGGWFTGCDRIADFMTSDYLNRALLLTDGLANVGLTGHEELVSHAKQLRQRGISTTTFGVGNDFNQFLLEGIADNGGGHFYFIDHPRQLPNYFAGELGEMLNTVAREITLSLNSPSNISIEVLNNSPSEIQSGQMRVFLGDAYSNQQQGVVLKLILPAVALGQVIQVPVTLHYEDVQQGRPVTLTGSPAQFTAAEAHRCERQQANQAVLQEAGQLTVNQAQQKARFFEHAGDRAGAKQVLRQSLADDLFAAMPNAPKFAAALEAEEAEIDAGRDEQTRKARHYASYQVMRKRGDYKKEDDPAE